MKQTLLLSALAFLPIASQAQETYLSTNFTDGIPSDFVLYDVDGNEPSLDMMDKGFAIGTPWITLEEGKEGNKVAASTSWYKKAGTSNDWMITSAFEVKSDKAVLSWRAMASDSEYRDGYKVYISTTGSEVSDFTSDAVFSVSKENASWTERQVSLADYVGQTIRVAFVNTTKDRAMLYVDDIFAGIPSCIDFSCDLEEGVMTQYGQLDLSGKAMAKEAISSFTVTVTLGEQTVTETFDKQIKAGASANWKLSQPFTAERGTCLPYSISIEANGDRTVREGKVNFIAHKVVAEEVTGTWCGYCVRGIVAMEQMRADHPDDYIGIAVHSGSANWPDYMAFDPADYIDPLFQGLGMSGYPHCTINRQKKYTGDPANIPSYYDQAKNGNKPKVDIALTAEYDAELDQITAHANLFSCTDDAEADYHCVFVMIENEVRGRGIGFWQSNYYSGVKGMGNFTNWPEAVPDTLMVYPDVARAIYGTYHGVAGLYPSVLEQGQTYNATYTLDSIPTMIHERANTELAVLLLNKNGVVANADKIKLADLDGYTTGIRAIETDDCKGGMNRVYTADGKCLGAVAIETLRQGIYIVEESMGDGRRRSRTIIVQ